MKDCHLYKMQSLSTLQNISLFATALLYGIAGVNHFRNAKFYLSIMPSFFPMPAFFNVASGVAEIVLAIGVLFASTRKISAYLIIAMLIAFFVIHISHLITPPKMAEGKYWVFVARIPMQFLLIYWAWRVSQY